MQHVTLEVLNILMLGGHLTKSGAKFFGKKLFENENLKVYKTIN